MNSNLTWVYCTGTKITVHTLFITIHNTVHTLKNIKNESHDTVHTLKNIKNESHDTIHTFKNYFATVLSVFSF